MLASDGRNSATDVHVGEIAVLLRSHRLLEPLRALCEVNGVRYAKLTRFRGHLNTPYKSISFAMMLR